MKRFGSYMIYKKEIGINDKRSAEDTASQKESAKRYIDSCSGFILYAMVGNGVTTRSSLHTDQLEYFKAANLLFLDRLNEACKKVEE